MRGLALQLALALALGSCYQPDYAGKYRCTPQTVADDCPDGWICVGQLCKDPAAAETQKLACRDRGTALLVDPEGEVWACRGDFAAGQLEAVCNGGLGYHPCGHSLRDDHLFGKIGCAGVAGFYVVDEGLSIGAPPKMTVRCEPEAPERPRALLGCGDGPGVTMLGGAGCHSLHAAIVCPAQGDWGCSADQGQKDASHRNAADRGGGVLCCIAPGDMSPGR